MVATKAVWTIQQRGMSRIGFGVALLFLIAFSSRKAAVDPGYSVTPRRALLFNNNNEEQHAAAATEEPSPNHRASRRSDSSSKEWSPLWTFAYVVCPFIVMITCVRIFVGEYQQKRLKLQYIDSMNEATLKKFQNAQAKRASKVRQQAIDSIVVDCIVDELVLYCEEMDFLEQRRSPLLRGGYLPYMVHDNPGFDGDYPGSPVSQASTESMSMAPTPRAGQTPLSANRRNGSWSELLRFGGQRSPGLLTMSGSLRQGNTYQPLPPLSPSVERSELSRVSEENEAAENVIEATVEKTPLISMKKNNNKHVHSPLHLKEGQLFSVSGQVSSTVPTLASTLAGSTLWGRRKGAIAVGGNGSGNNNNLSTQGTDVQLEQQPEQGPQSSHKSDDIEIGAESPYVYTTQDPAHNSVMKETSASKSHQDTLNAISQQVFWEPAATPTPQLRTPGADIMPNGMTTPIGDSQLAERARTFPNASSSPGFLTRDNVEAEPSPLPATAAVGSQKQQHGKTTVPTVQRSWSGEKPTSSRSSTANRLTRALGVVGEALDGIFGDANTQD